MVHLTLEVDLPPGVTITAYRRFGKGHGLEVSWPLPTECCCDRCRRPQKAHWEFKARQTHFKINNMKELWQRTLRVFRTERKDSLWSLRRATWWKG